MFGLIAAAFMALPGQVLVNTSYLCHMTGRVSESRCCAGKHTDACQAQVERPDCCELMQARGQATAPALRTSSQEVPAVALIGTNDFSLVARNPVARLHKPPLAEIHPPGPPRFLVNCSLLI
jgi:hypothetical protein